MAPSAYENTASTHSRLFGPTEAVTPSIQRSAYGSLGRCSSERIFGIADKPVVRLPPRTCEDHCAGNGSPLGVMRSNELLQTPTPSRSPPQRTYSMQEILLRSKAASGTNEQLQNRTNEQVAQRRSSPTTAITKTTHQDISRSVATPPSVGKVMGFHKHEQADKEEPLTRRRPSPERMSPRLGILNHCEASSPRTFHAGSPRGEPSSPRIQRRNLTDNCGNVFNRSFESEQKSPRHRLIRARGSFSPTRKDEPEVTTPGPAMSGKTSRPVKYDLELGPGVAPEVLHLRNSPSASILGSGRKSPRASAAADLAQEELRYRTREVKTMQQKAANSSRRWR